MIYAPLPFGSLIEQIQLLRMVRPFTLAAPKRIKSLYRLAWQIEREKIPGDVVECGVYNGGTAAVLARVAMHSRLDRTLWLFDSFEGMPQVTSEDGEAARSYVGKVIGSIDAVRSLLDAVGADQNRTRIIKGWFEDTFPTARIPQIALLNIDADWYESVKLCLKTFYDSVVPGGFISIDDYGHWPGCRKAVDEFLVSHRISAELHAVDYTARWFRKSETSCLDHQV